MQDDTKNTNAGQIIDDLEQAYKQTVSGGAGVSNNTNSSLSDEKQKINGLLFEIDKIMSDKKNVVEKKLTDLKTLKSEIETGLEELKKLETKKTTLQNEIEKINKIESDEKQIEAEVANLSTSI